MNSEINIMTAMAFVLPQECHETLTFADSDFIAQ